MIEGILLTLLRAIPQVNSAIGEHIYPVVIPENIKHPSMRYYLTDKPNDLTGSGPEERQTCHVQLDVFHHRYQQARAIFKSIQHSLHGYRGAVNTFQIDLIQCMDADSTFDQTTRDYRINFALNLKYKEISHD